MKRKLRKLLKLQDMKKTKTTEPVPQQQGGQDELSADLNDNVEKLQNLYTDCFDIIYRRFLIRDNEEAVLIYIDGLSNTQEIDSNVLTPLMEGKSETNEQIDHFVQRKLSISSIQTVNTISDCVKYISAGNPILLIDCLEKGFSFGLQKWDKRAIEEPMSEKVVRGPREGFIETLSVNVSLLRRRIGSPQLKMQSMEIGRYTQTRIVVSYMNGIAAPSLVEEVNTRLKGIDVDGVLDSGIIEEMIEDQPFSPFPQVLTTERPDVAAASLLEGRVVILVEGTPFVLIAPITFYSFLQSSEDYATRSIVGTSFRWTRYLLLVIALLLPSLYVAVITFHQEMVPTPLLIRMAASREQVPFPALVEALIMEVTLEALREAGIRLPKQVGYAVSIVGVLVLGEAAITAGIVSAPMVIVVAFTGIASFTIPRYPATYPIRLLRFPMMFLAGTLGLLGIILGVITIVIHMCTLRSFGVPYLSPMAPMKGREMKDVMMRAPWWALGTRPHFTGGYNKYRQAPNQKPKPPENGK